MTRLRTGTSSTPSSPHPRPARVTDHIKGGSLDGGSSAGPAAIAGDPDISVPMGFVKGLPVGVSFFGPAWTQPTLIRVACAFEQATQHRRSPTLTPTPGWRAAVAARIARCGRE